MCGHLKSTINDGLYFWIHIADHKLPTTKIPTLHKDNHNLNTPDSSEVEPISFAGACWEANLSTRQYVVEQPCF